MHHRDTVMFACPTCPDRLVFTTGQREAVSARCGGCGAAYRYRSGGWVEQVEGPRCMGPATSYSCRVVVLPDPSPPDGIA